MTRTLIAVVIFTTAVASGAELRPVVRPLPVEAGAIVADVAWQNDTLLVATEKGVFQYSADGKAAPAHVVAAGKIPDGIAFPESVDSNGTYSVVTALVPPSNYGWRAKDHVRAWAEQMSVVPGFDIVLTKDKACVLGPRWFRPNDEKARNIAVWCGAFGRDSNMLEPLHKIRSGEAAVKIFRSPIFHQVGAIVAEENGTIDVVTSAEPGVFRYAPNGTLLEVLGANVDDLILDRARELVDRYASDMPGRYRDILNRQPVIDDLVSTPGGPAIVVRIPDKNMIRWELWYPDATGGIRDRVRLGINRVGPYGHLRCAARAAKLACVASLPPQEQAAKLPDAQRYPNLLFFQLPLAQQLKTASR